MSMSSPLSEKVKRVGLNYYQMLMDVKAWSIHHAEFWQYFNTHKVSKNRAAQIVLNRYYSNTALYSVALELSWKRYFK